MIPERGRADVAEVWLAARRCASSLLLYPEAQAALARAERMRRLSRAERESAVRRLEALWEGVFTIEVTAELALRAGERAESYGLRAYDAVHLASLEEVGAAEGLLVSADLELLEAARALGYATAAAGV